MCASCFTAAESVAMQGMGAVVVAQGWLQRRAGAARGDTALLRRQRRWESTRAFVASLDLDPVEVLGAAPAPEPARR